ncbi:MAG: M20 family peptidase, partial [Mesotoga sp.]|nr:M20 family peptidase [Mesotoga sp.]
MKNRAAIIESVDLISADVVGLAKIIFEFSELSYEEYKSAETLIDFLKGKGFSVESPAIEELPTSFIASYGSSGPRVAVMAEYDALPEIGHACGHNLICTTSIAAAVALKNSGAID